MLCRRFKRHSGLIDEELGNAGLTIQGEARQRLAHLLGGDRLASRGELRKLALYCHGSGTVTDTDVAEAIGDVAALSVDDAVEAVFTGDTARWKPRLNEYWRPRPPCFWSCGAVFCNSNNWTPCVRWSKTKPASRRRLWLRRAVEYTSSANRLSSARYGAGSFRPSPSKCTGWPKQCSKPAAGRNWKPLSPDRRSCELAC
jgi:hypothetical protein